MGIKIELNLTNGWLYSIIALGLIVGFAIGAYAYQSGRAPSVVGHSGEEIHVTIGEETMLLDDALAQLSSSGGSDLDTCQLCRRYADGNRRDSTPWECVAFGEELLTDFRGDVDSNDDFDLKIVCD